MKTTLDQALIRWSVVCQQWGELSSSHAPQLGAFLAGWFWRDMDNEMPYLADINRRHRESFMAGRKEADVMISIMERDGR